MNFTEHDRVTKYRLSPLVSFRMISASEFEISLREQKMSISTDRLQLLLQFAEPSSIVEVHEFIVGELDLPQFANIVLELAAIGLLLAEGDPSGGPELVLSLQDYLNPSYCTDEVLESISGHLNAGRCLVIEHAFKSEFADRMLRCLEKHDSWKPYEEYSRSDFGYHHHNLYDTHLFPTDLRECHQIFASTNTKEFVGRVSNRDCSGAVAFGASLYLPGDYSLPHSDASDVRNVTFIWYLTRDWHSTWGGEFYWCPRLRAVPPSFNTLVMFNVSDTTSHFVGQVRPTARGRRFSINGWWQAPSDATARKPHPPTPQIVPPTEPRDVAGILVI